MTEFLEHANVSVGDLDEAAAFLRLALPEFKLRGRGPGPPRAWMHIGTEKSYIAFEEAARDDEDGHESYGHPGVNHLGFVVDDAEALRDRLLAAGYEVSFQVDDHQFRKRVYFYDRNRIEYEFVEYLSDDPAERNAYDRD